MRFSAPLLVVSAHNTSVFYCGEPSLDEWLRRHALSNQMQRASRTYVVLDKQNVVGYYSLAAGSIARAEATGKLRRNMPEPVPMVLIGRLAVDRSARGSGVGGGLLKDALLRVVQTADLIGVRGVMVDAISDKAKAFYEHFGFRASHASPLKLMIALDEAERDSQFAR